MKFVDSVNGEFETEEIKISFESGARVFVRIGDSDDEGRATIYTDQPELKAKIREFAEAYPEVVSVLVDDPEADATMEDGNIDAMKLYEDRGMLQAVFQTAIDWEVGLLLNTATGEAELVMHLED